MHRAPALSFSVRRSRWHLRLIASLILLAVVFAGAFLYDQFPPDVRTFVLAGATLATGVLAFLAWQRSPQGVLRWDGRAWYWSGFSDTKACQLSLLMDFQNLVLVSLTTDANRTAWLWLEAQPGDSLWIGLRRAIVSSSDISGEEKIADAVVDKEDPA